jgi:hypothetical protein
VREGGGVEWVERVSYEGVREGGVRVKMWVVENCARCEG